MLDLFNENIKDAYSSSSNPPLGKSDHKLVLLISTDEPILQAAVAHVEDGHLQYGMWVI